MTQLTFKDDATNHPYSSTIADFWNSHISSSNSRSYETTPKWNNFLQHNKIYHLFEYILKTLNFEKYSKTTNLKNTEKQFSSIELLNLLKKDNLDFTVVLKNTMQQDPKNVSGWQYSMLLPLYSLWLKSNNESISNELLEFFLYYKKNQQAFFSNSDDLIDTFFNLIDVLKDNHISYSWFKENLTDFAFSSFSIQDQIDNIDPLTYNISKNLSYESQLKIFNFVSENFPDKILDTAQYYPSFLIDTVYTTQDLFETSFAINLHKFAFDNSMTTLDSSHIMNIANLCLSIFSSPDFIHNIEPSISIVSSKVSTNHNDSTLTVSASTQTLEANKDFQNFFIPTLLSIIKDCDTIHLSYEDNYSGPPDLNTNLTLDVFSKYYLHSKFNSTINSNSNPSKKIKI